jgi:hypothetical protein
VDEIDKQAFDEYKRSRILLANNTIFPSGTGTFIPGEIIYQGSSLESANAQAIVYSYEPHQYADVIRVQGNFVSGEIKGNTSNALRSVSIFNTDTQVDDNVFEDISDNTRIESESDAILDWTEKNPFGEA